MDANEIDYLCSECGRVHAGPHAGLTFDQPEAISHIDEQGQGLPVGPEGREGNVSHGYCPECAERWLDRERAEHAKRQQRRRFRRGRKDDA